jgi:hypothetical protein
MCHPCYRTSCVGRAGCIDAETLLKREFAWDRAKESRSGLSAIINTPVPLSISTIMAYRRWNPALLSSRSNHIAMTIIIIIIMLPLLSPPNSPKLSSPTQLPSLCSRINSSLRHRVLPRVSSNPRPRPTTQARQAPPANNDKAPAPPCAPR